MPDQQTPDLTRYAKGGGYYEIAGETYRGRPAALEALAAAEEAAERQRQEAERQRKTAERQRKTAERQRKTAERRAALEVAAAEAARQRDDHPDFDWDASDEPHPSLR